MKQVHLIVAGFPGPANTAIPGGPERALTRMTGRGEKITAAHEFSPDERLARLFAPPGGLAELARARLELDLPGTEDGAWLCADPVHLRLARDHLLLGDAHVFNLGAEEAAGLIAHLNACFDGRVEFLLGAPTRWYARATEPLTAATRPLDSQLARPVEARSGDPAERALTRLLTEIQMALHEHPVNQAREARGADPINSLWLWGAGTRAPTRPAGTLYTDSLMARALARTTSMPVEPLEQFVQARTGHALIFIDAPHAMARYDLAEAWAAALVALDEAIFTPLWSRFRRGDLDNVIIEMLGPTGQVRRLRRWDAWKFWRS
jgi:hypothetical protein